MPCLRAVLAVFHASCSRQDPLSGCISAALWGIRKAGKPTSRSTSTSSSWYACAPDEASSSHMLRLLSALSLILCLPSTQKTSPNQAHLWAWFPRGVLEACLCWVTLCSRSFAAPSCDYRMTSFQYIEVDAPSGRFCRTSHRSAFPSYPGGLLPTRATCY